MSSNAFRPRAVLSLLAALAIAATLSACNPPERGGVSAADIKEGATKPAASSIDASVAEMFNGAKPSSIADTPINGLKEVVVNGNVYYASADGSYLISGEMMQVQGRKNLTSDARDRLRGGLMSKLDVKDAIVFKAKGEKKDVLNVFTDVECGYCREFHKHIEAYTNLGYEVHYYPWPRSGTSGPVYDEMVSVWCAKDRRGALTSAKSGSKPAEKTCDNPVSKYFELGREMGINGTPAIFLDSGKQIGGYVPPENMDAAIAAAKGATPAAGGSR